MKQVDRSVVQKTTVFMIVVVLVFATVAPALWRMDCLVSGRSKITWGEAAACMPANEHGGHDELNMQCCEFTSASVPHMDYVREGTAAAPLWVHLSVLSTQVLSVPVFRDHLIRIHLRPPPKRMARTVVVLRSLLI